MNSSESQTLAVLEAIERDSNLSQRDLARITGLNVAKVNFLIKRFAEKGLVKLQNVSRNPNKLRYLYILSPQGVSEKTRLAYKFMFRTLREYQRIRESVHRKMTSLHEEGVERVVLFGDNELTSIVVDVLKETNLFSILSVIDKKELHRILDAGGSQASRLEVLKKADRIVLCELDSSCLPIFQEQLNVPAERFVLMGDWTPNGDTP